MITDENKRIVDFEEKPEHPRSNLASMGIYIFSWKVLKEALIRNKDQAGLDFGKHIIPYCKEKGQSLFAYEFDGYWKDVGTLTSYWEANMELIDIVPEFNLYEEYWKIYTASDVQPPQYLGPDSAIERSIVGEGCEIEGKVYNSVIGPGVKIGKDTVVSHSIVMNDTQIGEGCNIEKAIIAEKAQIGSGVTLGAFEQKENETKPGIYCEGLVTIGERSVIPDNVKVGKNTMIAGITTADDYADGILDSGRTLDKAGD
jgi:glucose-1-phosphate adenylyltransferase